MLIGEKPVQKGGIGKKNVVFSYFHSIRANGGHFSIIQVSKL